MANSKGKSKKMSKTQIRKAAQEMQAKHPPKAPEKEKVKKGEVGAELRTVIDPVGKFNLDQMDERSMRGTFKDLKEAASHAGVSLDLKISREDSEEVVRKKLRKALRRFQTPQAMAALASINPDKLLPLQGQECKGVFINLNSAACVGCSNRDECMRLYLKNVPENFAKFRHAMEDAEATAQMIQAVSSDKAVKGVKEIVKKIQKEETSQEAKGSSVKAKKLAYEPDRRIGVLVWENDKNPYKKSHHAHDLVQEIYEKNPKTLGDLRAIVEEHIEFQGSSKEKDRQFMELVVGLLDDPPIIGFRKPKSE